MGQISQASEAMKIIFFNVLHCNRNTDEGLELIVRERPDVVVVIEASKTWRNALTGLAAIYPYRIYGPLNGELDDDPHMIGILAKRPWLATSIELSSLIGRAFAVRANFAELTVVGVHLLNPIFRPGVD